MLRLVLTGFFILSMGMNSSYPQKNETTPENKAKFYLNELQSAYRLGNYELFKAYSDSLENWGKEKKLYAYQILGIVNQGIYYNNKGEQNKAIKNYRLALELTDSIPEDHRTKIIVLANLGNAYTNINSHKKAIETMKTVVDLLDTREDNPRIRASAYTGMANNYENLGKDSMALDYHIKTKKLGEKIEDESVVATALNNISDYYLKKEDYSKARENLELALRLGPIQKKTKQRASLLIGMGKALEGTEDLPLALAYFKEAQELAKEKKLLALETDAYSYLLALYKKQGDSANANLVKSKYLELSNQLLENRESATKIDLEKDLNEKNEMIAAREEAMVTLEKNRKTLVLWSSILATVVLGLGLVFILYRKRTLSKNAQLQEQFASFQNSNNSTAIKAETKLGSYKNSSLTSDDFETYRKQLVTCMERDQPYLNPDLSQADLAKQLEISSHHLSEILNKEFNQNFYNFINSYRVLEAQKLMQQDQNESSKILAIAFDAGFKSKTSFNRVFKNHTGMTPSEYRKKLT